MLYLIIILVLTVKQFSKLLVNTKYWLNLVSILIV